MISQNQRSLRFNSLEDLETEEPDDASEDLEEDSGKEETEAVSGK